MIFNFYYLGLDRLFYYEVANLTYRVFPGPPTHLNKNTEYLVAMATTKGIGMLFNSCSSQVKRSNTSLLSMCSLKLALIWK